MIPNTQLACSKWLILKSYYMLYFFLESIDMCDQIYEAGDTQLFNYKRRKNAATCALSVSEELKYETIVSFKICAARIQILGVFRQRADPVLQLLRTHLHSLLMCDCAIFLFVHWFFPLVFIKCLLHAEICLVLGHIRFLPSWNFCYISRP